MNHNIKFTPNGVEVNGYTLNEHGEVELSENQYDDMLDYCNEMVSICGMEYSASHALKQIDPIAYNCGKSEYESSLQEDIDSEIDDFIEEIQETLTGWFEADTETDSDTIWNYFSNVGEMLDYYATSDNLCQVSQQIRKHLEIEPDESYQGFTFEQIKEKAIETLVQSPELYCYAKINHSYWNHRDSVLSVNIGEFEHQIPDEYETELWPEWLIDKVNRSSDFTINRGFAYFVCNGAELILKNPTEFFNDVIEYLIDEQTEQNNGE